MLDELKKYILEYCAFGGEPLHILMSALIEDHVISNPGDAVQPILDIMHDGYLMCYDTLGLPPNPYRKVSHLTREQLSDYIKRHERKRFAAYPAGEYYFETTESGQKLIPDAFA